MSQPTKFGDHPLADTRFALLADTFSQAVFSTSLSGQILHANPPMRQLLQAKLEEVRGLDWRSLIHPKDRELLKFSTDPDTGSAKAGEYLVRIASHDSSQWIKLRRSAFLNEQGPSGFVIQAELHPTTGSEVDRMVLDKLSRDLLNLLTISVGHLELSRIQPETTRGPDLVYESLDQAALLIRELFGASEEGHSIDANELVQQSVNFIRPRLTSGIRIHTNLDPSIEATRGHQLVLSRAILNLIQNALEAIPDEGLISLYTNRHSQGPTSFTRISVVDTGCGISAEEQEHVFKLGFSTKQDSGGRGLGLAIVHACARQHGGRVHIESKQGSGCRVHLDLPTKAPRVRGA